VYGREGGCPRATAGSKTGASRGPCSWKACDRLQPLRAALRAAGFFAALFLAPALAAPAALRSARFGSTAALKPAPGTNFGTFIAAIFTASPVLGLKPVRAARVTWRKVPRPTKLAVSPFLTAATMDEKTVSRMRAAAAFERSCSAASFSTSSMRFMGERLLGACNGMTPADDTEPAADIRPFRASHAAAISPVVAPQRRPAERAEAPPIR